ncbi:MAG: formamidopyrimidine-DNA glycosylase [Planctomycetaceae bacterium]|nr:MAG: formamidopyrimidine-DNA glycosylase [Planctomycetaceae bacterium]
MPELPEVETMVRGLRETIVGSTIVDVVRWKCLCKPLTIRPSFPVFRNRQLGQQIGEVLRLGKRVVLVLHSGSAVVIEPRMTGLMLISDPPDEQHLRLCWQLKRNGDPLSLWFWDRRGLGVATWHEADGWRDALQAVLGYDALQLTADDWQRLCQQTVRPIKLLLLDQRRVCGIGNLYASEILHVARIHPAQPAQSLRANHVRRLYHAVQDVLLEAISYEGSTLADGTYRTALSHPGRYQNVHRVYAREGAGCLTCQRAVIQRIIQAQRSTYFCPRCQPLRSLLTHDRA